MKSVLGKLIQQRFGRERYTIYTRKLEDKESMDIFCDIYEKLQHQSADDLNDALRELLGSVQTSIRISRNFLYISLGYFVAMLMLFGLHLILPLFVAASGIISVCYLYKFVEFIRNRYCDRDVRIVLIYKIALFQLLEETCLQNEGNGI